jgi:hypothetical protein
VCVYVHRAYGRQQPRTFKRHTTLPKNARGLSGEAPIHQHQTPKEYCVLTVFASGTICVACA